VPQVVTSPESHEFVAQKKKKSPKRLHEIYRNYIKMKKESGGMVPYEEVNKINLSPTANQVRYVNTHALKFPRSFN
jgi:hypothetical protein